MTMPKPNTLHPGLPDYVGPTEGYFTLLHHEGPLVEGSSNVMERIRYIDTQKPTREIATRKRHIVYVPDSMISAELRRAHDEWRRAHDEWRRAHDEWRRAHDELRRAHDKLRRAHDKLRRAHDEWRRADDELRRADAEWRRADAELRRVDGDKLLAYLHKHVPDCKWNGKELVFE